MASTGSQWKNNVLPVKTLVFIVAITALSACNNPFRKAEYYHNYLASRQAELMSKVFELSRNMAAMDSTGAFQALDEVKKYATGVTEEIKQTPPFRKDTSLRHATIEVAEAYGQVIETDLSRMAGMVARHELTDSTGAAIVIRMRRSMMKKLINPEKEFARQEGLFRRTYLGGKDIVPADTTYFTTDTTEESEL